MLLRQQTEEIKFTGGGHTYSFLLSGDVKEFLGGRFMINQFVGNPLDGSMNNIYLKVKQEDKSEAVYPLLGYRSQSALFYSEDGLLYKGEAEGIAYQVIFTCDEAGCWFWTVKLFGTKKQVQLVYGQDMGVGDKGGVRTNELYLSQYLDHFVDEGEHGYTICSRQNQNQGGAFPYVQQGCLNKKIVGFCTDAMQFFGKQARKNQRANALYEDMPAEKYQYELSYIGLWTEWFEVNSEETVIFYGIFKENMPEAVRKAMYMDEIRAAYERGHIDIQAMQPVKMTVKKEEIGGAFSSDTMTKAEIEAYFPNRILEEYEDDTLLSFFEENDSHVVLQEKELIVERPHGNIITNLPDDKKIRKDLMTSTNFMNGLFHAQTTIGNTDSNRLLSANRGLLNIQKYTGQRIWIKLDGVYRVLALPAAYEMALNYSKWFYKIGDDMLTVTAAACDDAPGMQLGVVSEKGVSYEFIVTSQLSMGSAEFNEDIVIKQHGHTVLVMPTKEASIKNYYPDLMYRIDFPQDSVITDDSILYEDGLTRNGTMLCASFSGSKWLMTMMGQLYENGIAKQDESEMQQAVRRNPETMLAHYIDFYNAFKKNAHLGFKNGSDSEEYEAAQKLNVLTTWYVHNAFVHFYVPRGLEQRSGAAWGTRDVCQGPMELFLTTAHFELARETLLEIFAHQNVETKEWPQWFMFDEYPYMAGDCHGDVIFWPLKCLGDYMEYTGDYTILNECVPYRRTDGSKTERETVMQHLMLALDAIKERFIGDTALISYAGGDWDDTLQPADPKMKEHLVSAWTQALAYQTLNTLCESLKKAEDRQLREDAEGIKPYAKNIREDFYKYLIKDNVIAGFAYIEDNGDISYMLHPSDEKTGIHYRLLPLTRSIISGLSDEALAQKNVNVIDEKLTFPDGIRLMDCPARYDGGVSKYFQRAEQASNVGREISLQYVHAHIRYLEAMAALGDGEKVYENLMKIVPVNIKDTVKNACRRQSNAYFSSSEGNFKDRYEYAEKFELLRTGEMEVKGGWRIYSSGPGIFLGRLIGNMLGIREKADRIEIDPVLSKKLDGLNFDYQCFGKNIRFIYHVKNHMAGVERIECAGKEITFDRLQNPYRQGGAVVRRTEWEDCLEGISSEDMKQIHIYLS